MLFVTGTGIKKQKVPKRKSETQPPFTKQVIYIKIVLITEIQSYCYGKDNVLKILTKSGTRTALICEIVLILIIIQEILLNSNAAH